jgi:hypothetical protein
MVKIIMRKIYLLLFNFIISYSSIAQQQSWIIGPTKLYNQPNKDATNKGILLRGAYVKKINSAENNWQKIEVYAGLEGYVPVDFLVKNLNGGDTYEPSPEPIIEKDEYYGSQHLFVTVASLKARSEPSQLAKISKIYTNGEPISVYYYPKNDTDWVVTSAYNKNEFVQKKFIGLRPDINELFTKYDGIIKSDINNRRMFAERAVELAWNNADNTVLPALERFLMVAKDLKNQQLIDDTELNIFVLKAQSKKLSTVKIGTIVNSKKSYAVIKNTKVSEKGIDLKTVNKLLGKPIKKSLNECSGTESQTFFNATFELFEKNICYLDELYFVDFDCYYLDGYRIDKTITEKEFVTKFANIITVSGFSPHEYSITYDEEYSRINVFFKDGKIERITWFSDDC